MDECQPAIILVEPQLGDNVGSAARAMLNCGLTDLRLVKPRDGWPNPRAQAMASGAREVIDKTRVFETLAEAIADLQWICATTGRRRDMVKDEITPVEAAHQIRRRSAGGERSGILFGRERIGLTNEETVIADAILTVPLNPAFCSLNLGQAVLLVAYEWFRVADETPARQQLDDGYPRATRKELLGFLDHLEEALDAGGYFKVEEMKPSSLQSIRNVFTRAELTDREVRTFHGIVTNLVGCRRDQLQRD